MATKSVKARVEIDGEKQYKQALSELNSGNKVLASEMKKLQAEYKGNADSIEFLTKKGDLLQRQLQQQKDKVKTLQDAVAASAQKYGEADKRTQDWVAKLNNAEAAQYELEHAIDENNKAIEVQGKSMVGLGDAADKLASKLGVQLPEGAKEALNSMQSLSAGSVAALAAIAAGAAATMKAIKALHEMTIEAAHDVDDLVTQSMVSGISTKTLQEMQYAAQFVDVSVETVTGSMRKLTSEMASAQEGNQSAVESFEKLGVSIYDSTGHLRSSEEVFYEVVDALGQIENPTERDAAAMEVFGKSAQELNPLIIAGSDALKDYATEAEAVGYVLSEEQVAALAAVDDAWQKNQLQIEAAKKQLAAEFAPASKAAMETFTKAVKVAGDMLVNSHIIENLGQIIVGVTDIINIGVDLVGALPSWMNPLNQVSNAFKGLAIVLATVADALKIVIGLTPGFWGSGMLKSGLGLGSSPSSLQSLLQGGTGEAVSYSNPNWGYDSAGRAYDLSTGNYIYNAAGTDNWRGGLTWVGEAGPELVSLPRGSQIMNSQESFNMAGGQYITINVNGIEQMDEVVRWYSSMRVRERMA